MSVQVFKCSGVMVVRHWGFLFAAMAIVLRTHLAHLKQTRRAHNHSVQFRLRRVSSRTLRAARLLNYANCSYSAPPARATRPPDGVSGRDAAACKTCGTAEGRENGVHSRPPDAHC